MNTRTTTNIAVLSALSAVFMIFFEVPIFEPLRYDPSNIPALIGGFAFSTGSVIVILIIRTLAAIAAAKNIIGSLMALTASLLFCIPAVLLYHCKKSRQMALAGMLLGTALMMAGMYAAVNLLGFWYPEMAELIIGIILPFNLVKGLTDTVLTFFVYKRISGLIKRYHASKIIPQTQESPGLGAINSQ